MRKLSFLLALALLSAAAVRADKDGVPPGLQKKGGLPPGQAKKHKGEADEAKTAAATTASNAAPAVAASNAAPAVPAPGTPVAIPSKSVPPPAPAKAPPTTKADLEKRAKVLNTLDNKAPARRAGYIAIERETGASLKAIEAQHREFPDIGTAGLLIANEISAKTKKPAATYLRQHNDGRSWTAIANDHKVDLDTINTKLGRVEDAMKTAK